MRILHRVVQSGKSLYCGYQEATAARTYFAAEPEATSEDPVIWTRYMIADRLAMPIEAQQFMRAPALDGNPKGA